VSVKTCEVEQLELPFTPTALVFDGSFIWMSYQSADQGEWWMTKIDLEGNISQDKIAIGEAPANLVFDGTHLWFTHKDGATRIDPAESDTEGTTGSDSAFTAAAFDGAWLWAAEPEGGRVHRIDIYSRKSIALIRPFENTLPAPRHFARMCCDGNFIWLTDHVEGGGKTAGVIYRFLV
jgi:hypothetical protein